MWIDWDGKTQRKAITEHAEQLGVDPLSLYYLRAVWAEEHQAWAWPMYDGQGKMCGMRLRAVNGEKWAVKHSESGLFVPNGIPVQPRLHLVEGPTDCAAALSIGLYAIGRPSCRGQEKTVCDTVRRLKIKEVVIIADADVPGQEGARRMQEELLVPSVVITPPGKDVREAVADGWNLDQVEAAVKNLVWSIK
jgi:5S rRNA maturation endonuclease (ribonuclease M5)